MNKTTFDTRLEKMLDDHAKWYIKRTVQFMKQGKEPSFVTGKHEQDEEAKAQLRTLVNDVCMEVINTSKPIFIKNDLPAMLETDDYIKLREELRQRQRTKLATILEGSE